MCGIFGGYPNLLHSDAVDRIRHRGPDQSGSVKLQDYHQRDIILAGTRLNIVNKKDMIVPYEFRGYTICFNGEIYNWLDLRKKLSTKGYKFETDTDTEVFLKAFVEWGEDALNLFNGMFAAVIWDGRDLTFIRDRLGKKPLFIMRNSSEIAFASELKAFSALEYKATEHCEDLEFYFDEHVPFKFVASLKAGELAKWNSKTRKFFRRKWWEFPEYIGDINDEKNAVKAFLDLFFDACKLRMSADVPVTVFQSGGLDSSLIQAIVKADTTLTVEFDEFNGKIDESSFTQEMSKAIGYENQIINPTRTQFLEALPIISRHIEFKVGSFSLFPLYMISKIANEQGFKVALSGEGADELFNGYFRHEIVLQESQRIQEYLQGDYKELAQKYFGNEIDRFVRIMNRGDDKNFEYLRGLFTTLWSSEAPLAHNLSSVETQVFLQPLLTMADRMSMANSVEVRNPFLDFRLVEFAARLSPSLKFQNGRGKHIIRKALEEVIGHLELSLLDRKTKHGLPAPINMWLFGRADFDRTDWNNFLATESLKTLQ